MPATNLMPGYVWSSESGRYRSTATGRYVARARVLSLLETHVGAKEASLARLTEAVIEQRISPVAWLGTVRAELKRLYLQDAALGAGGIDKLDAKDMARIEASLRFQYRHLAGFAADIRDGKVSTAQGLSRIRMYMGEGRSQYFIEERDRLKAKPGMAVIERRQPGASEHCPDCIAYYMQGWQPIGVLPVPGIGSQCMGNCRCNLIHKEVPVAEIGEWIGTKR